MKLHINLHQGVLEVEGDEALVLRVYEDFRDRIANSPTTPPAVEAPQEADATTNSTENTPTKRTNVRRRGRSRASSDPTDGKKEKVTAYTPAIDKNLDTKGLSDYYEQFSPKNQAERILIYARFLEEQRNIKPCSANQIFTCYRETKQKIPEAFLQAFRDASSKQGYIDYNSPTEISVTVRGLNYIEHGDIPRK